MFNSLVFNPAIAGSKEQISSNFQYRNHTIGNGQLSEIKSFGIHAPFKHQRIGLGLQLYQEKYTIQNRLSATVSFAYKINFKKGTFSFGLNAGLLQSSFRFSDLVVLPAEKANLVDLNVLTPDIGSGIYYQTKNYYVGISALHLLPSNWNKSNYKSEYEAVKRHYYLVYGHKIGISEKLVFLPTLLFKYVDSNRFLVDISMHLKFADLVWTGISIRTNNLYSVQAGVKLSDLLSLQRQSIKIGYAYDWSDNPVSLASGTSHEIMLILDLEIHEKPSKIRKNKINISPVLF